MSMSITEVPVLSAADIATLPPEWDAISVESWMNTEGIDIESVISLVTEDPSVSDLTDQQDQG